MKPMMLNVQSLLGQTVAIQATNLAKTKGKTTEEIYEADEAAFSGRSRDNETQAGPAGFMDQQKELIVALRDVGGLRWGAADFGKASGDVMHFDGHHMALAGAIRRAKEEIQAARKAAATKKDTEEGGMLSFALAFCIELAVLGAEPAPPSFDEATAKSACATFAYQWHSAMHGPDRTQQRWRRTKVAPDAAPVAKWPIGARGIYGNSFKARSVLRWVAAGLDKAPHQAPEPLGELFEQWEYCHESELEARACVPGACYFVPRCEYGNGGYWLALREAASGPELVGVLIWKEDRPAPTKEPHVATWLAGIAKGLAAPQLQ